MPSNPINNDNATTHDHTITHSSHQNPREEVVENNDYEIALLQILCTDIYLDGGGSLVTALKEYRNQKRKIDSLLVKSCIRSKKLLTFLQTYPSIFHVKTTNPHFVTLLSKEFVIVPNSSSNDKQYQKQKQEELYNKIMYVFRKRISKLKRRHKKENERETHMSTTTTTVNKERRSKEEEERTVNFFWLLQQVVWQFHYYLRTIGFYNEVYGSSGKNSEDNDDTSFLPVKIVGSVEWYDLVLQQFKDYIIKNDIARMDPEHTERVYYPRFLELEYLQEQQQQHPTGNQTILPMITTTTVTATKEEKQIYLIRLCQKLEEILNKDAATQVGLPLLLHRYVDLKNLLGGRDLLSLVKEDPSIFQNIVIEKQNVNPTNENNDGNNSGENGELYLKLKKKKQATTTKTRMFVNEDDEEGLFSVTSSRWSIAMANLLMDACRRLSRNSNDDDMDNQDPKYNVTALDLTASIGGNTWGLAKVFHKVIAIEINKNRSLACQKNMKKHNMEHIVQVYNADSMDFILTMKMTEQKQDDTHISSNNNSDPNTSIATTDTDTAAAAGSGAAATGNTQRSTLSPIMYAVFIDPPWGGIHYKKNVLKDQTLCMGKWKLEDVLERVGQLFSPVIVGLNLPLTFHIPSFVQKLNTAAAITSTVASTKDDHEDSSSNPTAPFALHADIVVAKKLGPQLFVILYILSREK